jgi:hypothetical protein
MSIASQPENAAICNASPEHWVVVNGWLTMGGAERQSLRLAEVLLKQGHQVTFIGLANPGIVQDECARLGIPCHYWPLQMVGRPRRRILADLWRFLRFIRSLRPTYLAPYCMPPNVACGVIWRWTGARACVWQQRDEGRHFQPKTLERLALRWTPAFISNSSHARQWVTDNGVDPAKISVVARHTWHFTGAVGGVNGRKSPRIQGPHDAR